MAAIFKNDSKTHAFIATAVHGAGDVIFYDGAPGVFVGLKTCAIGDTCSMSKTGAFTLPSDSGVTFAARADVRWDASEAKAVSAGGDYVIGKAKYAKTAGQLAVQIDLRAAN
jgi:predicted RecA/RadA family phage recombinase